MTASTPTPHRSITSRRNAHVQRWLSLWERRGIATHRRCLVSGEKLVNEILGLHADLCQDLIEADHARLPVTPPAHLARFRLAKPLFHELDRFGTRYPLLVCRFPPVTDADLAGAPGGLELLCPLGDPANLGAIIRSCCAFAASRVILLREAAHPFHPKAIRASGGAVFRQSLHWGPGIGELQDDAVRQWIVALDLDGTALSAFEWPANVRILVGEEGMGLPPPPFPRRVSIPHSPAMQSLNATVAASIALFAYRQRHPLAPARGQPLHGRV